LAFRELYNVISWKISVFQKLLLICVNSVLRLLHGMDVGEAIGILEIHADSIFDPEN
jgi:hypothetical protein